MSYGRAIIVFQFIQENWRDFDSWCCMKNIDPISLPAYRFYNLAIAFIKENRTDDGMKDVDNWLKEADKIQHPIKELINPKRIQKITGDESKQIQKPEERHKYIPPWWVGEEKAYQIAMVARKDINSLPKMNQ